MTHVSRRDRRRAARKSLAAANAASAGRATAAVLAASGLVISTGVAANAADDTTDGRDSSTVQLNTSQLTVERASHPTVEAVTASNDTELTFDRPAVSSEASPERVAAEEAAAEQESAAEQAAAEQAERDAEAERAAEAQAQQNADAQQAQPAQQEQAQQEQAQPAQQEQAQPAQQQSQPTPQADSNSGASAAGGADQQPASSSGGRSGVVGAAYGLIGIPWSQMDCSAMVQNAYASAGISVPRDTYGQMTLPRVSSPAPGDIVISNGGGHAAIYIGNGQVISSTSSQGIRVHGLHEAWHNVNSYHRPG